jgi:glycosyltransferase involved in cell wall biosynthesis
MTRATVLHAGNMWGGVERVLATVAAAAQARSALVLDFALAFDGPLAAHLRQGGFPVTIVGPARLSRPFEVLSLRRRLAHHLRRVRPDVAVTQSAWSQAVMGPVVKRARLPLVWWVHDVLDGRHWLQRLALRVPPQRLICNSHFTASQAAPLMPAVPASVVYPPLEPLLSPPAPREDIRGRASTRVDATVILQVGRADPVKGHQVLLAALERLPRALDWICWQVGGPQNAREDAYWRSLQQWTTAHGVQDRVRWLGPQQAVADWLGAADIYCQPNVGPEAFGLSLVEAMRAGLPVVTSPLGAAPELLDEQSGVLVKPDAATLSATLRELIEDPARRDAVRASGPHRAAMLCDPDASLSGLVDALQRVTVSEAA